MRQSNLLMCALVVLMSLSSLLHLPTPVMSSSESFAAAGMTVYDVTDYGAIGDGVTECGSAVSAATSAMLNQSMYTGGTLYFPPGKFLLSSIPFGEAFITIRSNFNNVTWSISGAGVDETTLVWNYQSASILTLGDDNSNGISFRFENLTVTARSGDAASLSYYMISAMYFYDVSLAHLAVRDENTSVALTSSYSLLFLQFGSTVMIDDVNVWTVAQQGQLMNFNVEANDIIFTRCDFVASYGTTMLWLDGNFPGLKFDQCSFTGFGIAIDGVDANSAPSLTDCTFVANGIALYAAQSGSFDIVNCDFIGTSATDPTAAGIGIKLDSPISVVQGMNNIRNNNFAHLASGVIAGGGGPLDLESNTFTSCSQGLSFYATQTFGMVNVAENVFDSCIKPVNFDVQYDLSFVTNECKGDEANMLQVITACTTAPQCAIQNNQGCVIVPMQP